MFGFAVEGEDQTETLMTQVNHKLKTSTLKVLGSYELLRYVFLVKLKDDNTLS